MTDVGARCPTCAPRRKLPQLEVGPLWLGRGALAATAAGAALGAAWWAALGAATGFLWVRHVDLQPATLEGLTVQLRDGRVGFRLSGHFHETESPRLPRHPVGDHRG